MHEIVATVYRGEGQESVHHGAVAVVNAKGELTHYVGEPDFFTQARSEAKPFQSIALLRSGAADYYHFTDKQLAIMCGSHIGTEEHVRTVKSILDTAGLDESYLMCGTHQPMFYALQNRLPRANENFSPLQHNCSGKHSGFLALARFLKEDPTRYLDPAGKVQQLVLDGVSELYGYPREKIKIGIDGCSAPVFGMPLKQAAIAYVRLSNQISDDPATRAILGRIKKAMTAHPEMVSGEGRFDLALARTFPGNVINKIGAEGVEGIGFSEPSVGIAVKILDGNERALYPVVIEVLRQLGLLEGVDMTHLKPFVLPQITNYRNMIVGRIVPEFALKKA
ncbi:MAG: asparaginase [candidate division Zixibacteria bacterium]|nr:asparaginase [candidate division Zixibacteria bacterium]